MGVQSSRPAEDIVESDQGRLNELTLSGRLQNARGSSSYILPHIDSHEDVILMSIGWNEVVLILKQTGQSAVVGKDVREC